MTNEEIRVQLKSIEQIVKEGFEKLNQRITALDEGFESNQERFDVLEEHAVMFKDDMDELKKKYDSLEKVILERHEKNIEC
ncbi:hypothetical protein [Robertmurraya massiliosenegalensis]|uniref:hypothetical protein n=1 Tax=Robertmurraya massiliosenegalensis TaxID=1287657 RepID=UPI00030E1F31|nr:hypothetical protein [Robertmurraya massiliosenegalensis]